MNRWLLAILPLAVLLLIASLFAFYALRKTSTRIEPNFTVGQEAPEIMLSYLEGGPPVSLRAQIQGPALVNTFASWCTPCAAESPYLMEMKAQGARIIGLAQKDSPANTARFLARWGDPYAVILDDPEQRGTIDFGATGIPETFVIDSRGRIVGKHTGPIENEAQMNRLLQTLATAN